MDVNKGRNNFDKQPVSSERSWTDDFYPFRNIDTQTKIEVMLNAEKIIFPSGDFIVKPGDIEKGVFFIHKGTVKVSRTGSTKEFILWFAKQGDMVGLESFADNAPFTFFATAIEDVTAYFIPASDLRIILRKEPSVTSGIMKKICERVYFMEARLTSISRKKMRAECAEMLLTIARTQGGSSTGKTAVIDYGLDDLASLVGTTRNYLYKIMLQFANKNILTIKKRKFIINNLDALTVISREKDR
jgi:CRP/FNR family transcriptional regulator, polysaccharide utilization system transcription regulator